MELEETEKNLIDYWKSRSSLIRDEVKELSILKILREWLDVLSDLQTPNREKLVTLEDELRKRIIGQDFVVKLVANAIRCSRAGLSDPNRPVASFMFIGLRGVGKTELAKALSACLFNSEEALVRLDMSKYMEKHAVSRLVGPPSECVGYEGKWLTEVICQRPYRVIFFDKIEKAHPDVLKIQLQLLDEGRITDSQGRTVSFTKCVVIMTSNVASQHIPETLQDTSSKDAAYAIMKKHVVDLARKTFCSEFMNRFDECIIFQSLHSGKSFEIALLQVKEKLKKKSLFVECAPRAALFITQMINQDFGAGHAKWAIQQIETEIANGVLRGDFKQWDLLLVDV